MDRDKMKELRSAMNARMILLAAGVLLILNAVTSSARNGLNWMTLAGMVTEYQAEDHSDEETEEAAETKEDGEAVSDTAEAEPDTKESAEAAEDTAEAEPDTKESAEAAEDTKAADSASETTDEAASAEKTEEASAEEQNQVDIKALIKNMDELGVTVTDLRILGVAFLVLAVLKLVIGIFCVKFSNRVDKAEITFKMLLVLIAAELIVLALMVMKKTIDIGTIFNSFVITAALFWGAMKMKKLHKADPERVLAVKTGQPVGRQKPAPTAPKKSIREKAMMTVDDEKNTAAEPAAPVMEEPSGETAAAAAADENAEQSAAAPEMENVEQSAEVEKDS